VARGLVIGGGMQWWAISDPKVEIKPDYLNLSGNIVTKNGLGMFMMGPFIDWFPNDEGGGHLGALIGVGVIGLSDENDKNTSSGGAGAIWGGYDFWIADQWSLGGALRLTGITGRHPYTGFDDKLKDSAGTIQLMFTGLYH
jgi:hypothetical protein